MLNTNIHIHHYTDYGHEAYFIADRAGDEKSDPPITTEADILPRATALNENGDYVGFYFVAIAKGYGESVHIQRCSARADSKGNVSAAFFYKVNSIQEYKFTLDSRNLGMLVHNGKLDLGDLGDGTKTFAYTDFNRMRNDVFAILSGWLDQKLTAEVERERVENAAHKVVRQLSSIASKGYGTKLKHNTAHTIYDFITSDDEWWCSLPKEKKRKIRTENS